MLPTWASTDASSVTGNSTVRPTSCGRPAAKRPRVVEPRHGADAGGSRSSTSFVGIQPNPFRDVTTIDFVTERASVVGLAVYDVAGRLVRMLAHAGVPAD